MAHFQLPVSDDDTRQSCWELLFISRCVIPSLRRRWDNKNKASQHYVVKKDLSRHLHFACVCIRWLMKKTKQKPRTVIDLSCSDQINNTNFHWDTALNSPIIFLNVSGMWVCIIVYPVIFYDCLSCADGNTFRQHVVLRRLKYECTSKAQLCC